MGKIYNNLISTTAGFNYAAKQPLDDRTVVQSYQDLSTLVNSNLSYDGMQVYVVDDGISYILTASGWVAVATQTYVDNGLGNKVNKINGKGLSTNDFTNELKQNYDEAYEHSQDEHAPSDAEKNVQSDWNVTDENSDAFIKNKPIIDTEVANNSINLITSGAVYTAIANLPEPMIFKGSLGTGGTITSLPTAATENEGFTYKVITAGTYTSKDAKVGDTFISTGEVWELIPSGDEPSGTVTSVGVSVPTGLSVSSSPVTTSGTIAITYTDGYSIPTIAKQREWDAKQGVISNLTTIISEASTGATHANTSHARADATKVEASSTNGYIKINDIDTIVYTHPTGTNPHGTTKNDVGLGKVGNFKAVSTEASQGLSDTEKSNARANIGAATSEHDHDDKYYTESEIDAKLDNYLTGYEETDPTVPEWAKADEKPTYNYSEIVDAPQRASELQLGLIKAPVKWISDIMPVRISSDGYLYTNPGTLYSHTITISSESSKCIFHVISPKNTNAQQDQLSLVNVVPIGRHMASGIVDGTPIMAIRRTNTKFYLESINGDSLGLDYDALTVEEDVIRTITPNVPT